MSARRIKNHGTWVWQGRVAYRGLRKAAFRHSREAARDAEAELLRALRHQVEQAETAAAAPATFKLLFELYAADLEARGKGAETVYRARQTRKVLEPSCPSSSNARSRRSATPTCSASARRAIAPACGRRPSTGTSASSGRC